MKIQPEHREALKTLLVYFRSMEEKARYVRNPDYWGAPYGTPLPLPPGVGRRGRVVDAAVSAPKPRKPRAKKSAIPSFTFKNWYDNNEILEDPETGNSFGIESKGGYITLVAYDKDGEVISGGTKVDVKTRHFTQMEFNGRMQDNEENRQLMRSRAMFLAKKPYIDEETKRVKAEKREKGGLVEEWWGIYGIDWQNDGDEPLVDPNNPEERLVLAKIAADELGIKYVHREGTSEEIHFESIETINSLVGTMDGIVPGLAAYVPIYGMDSGSRSALAYAVKVSTYESTAGYPNIGREGFQRGSGIDYPHAAIGLSKNLFSDNWDYWATYREFEFAKANNFWSVDPNDVAERAGWEDWQALMIQILTHEIGHAVGYVGIGEMASSRDEARRQEISEKFRKRLAGIFEEFGIVTSANDVEDSIFSVYASRNRTVASSMSQILTRKQWDYAKIDRTTITYLLSEYGSSNMHEMFAESWSEYMLADKPRPFAQAVGSLMEETMKEFIDYEYGETD